MSESFGEAMQRLQAQAGQSSEQLQEVSQAILDMAKVEPANGSPRDTQFVGFACRLLQELLDQCAYVAISPWVTGGDSFKSEQLIARRAYDLVSHVLNNTGPYMIDCLSHEEQLAQIPDMTAWPEEAKTNERP